MSETIRFFVGLPPKELRSNTRAFWGAKVRAKQAYSREVLAAVAAVTPWFVPAGHPAAIGGKPWQRARVVYTWRYCGVAPDQQNLGANLKALTDIICMAPDNGLQANNTTYLGLIEDDKGIVAEYQLKQVKHRGDQGVLIEITQTPGVPAAEVTE